MLIDQPPNKALPSVPSGCDAAPQRCLPQVPDEDTSSEYSYASVEFRSMSIEDESLVTTIVDDKTRPPHHAPDESGEYSYVSVTSRPMAVGLNGGISIPVRTEKALIDFSMSGGGEENGDIDAKEIDSTDPEDFLHTTINNDVYALVDKPPKYQAAPSLITIKQQPTTAPKSIKQSPTSTAVHSKERRSSYDMVADPQSIVSPNPNIEDLYAAVQKPLKNNNTNGVNKPVFFNNSNTLSPFNNNNVIYPAGFKPGQKRVSDGMLNTKYFPNVVGRKPPPIPRPYGKGMSNLIYFFVWLKVVCVTEQHYVSKLFTRLWSVLKLLLFRCNF